MYVMCHKTLPTIQLGSDWRTVKESNPQPLALEATTLPIELTIHYMEQREGFEPPVLVICNHLHWAALPPLRKLLAGSLGIEPSSTALQAVAESPD
jgi:hypothetical protein